MQSGPLLLQLEIYCNMYIIRGSGCECVTLLAVEFGVHLCVGGLVDTRVQDARQRYTRMAASRSTPAASCLYHQLHRSTCSSP